MTFSFLPFFSKFKSRKKLSGKKKKSSLKFFGRRNVLEGRNAKSLPAKWAVTQTRAFMYNSWKTASSMTDMENDIPSLSYRTSYKPLRGSFHVMSKSNCQRFFYIFLYVLFGVFRSLRFQHCWVVKGIWLVSEIAEETKNVSKMRRGFFLESSIQIPILFFFHEIDIGHRYWIYEIVVEEFQVWIFWIHIFKIK